MGSSEESPTNSKVTRPALDLPMLMSKKTRLRLVSAIFNWGYVRVGYDVVQLGRAIGYATRRKTTSRMNCPQWKLLMLMASRTFYAPDATPHYSISKQIACLGLLYSILVSLLAGTALKMERWSKLYGTMSGGISKHVRSIKKLSILCSNCALKLVSW